MNPFRPRYAIYRLTNLPEMVKSATIGDEMCTDTYRIDRGGWGERALKEQQHVPGDLPRIATQINLSVNNDDWESITVDQPLQKSDRP